MFEKKRKEEIKDVTFKPSINHSKRLPNSDKKPEERFKENSDLSKDKKAKLKSKIEKERKSKCSFRPRINKK